MLITDIKHCISILLRCSPSLAPCK